MPVNGIERSVHGSSTRRDRDLSRAGIVAVEVVVGAGILLASVAPAALRWPVLMVSLSTVFLVVPWGTRGSLAARTSARLAFWLARLRRRAVDLAPAAFDIPVGTNVRTAPLSDTRRARVDEPSDAVIGARWAGNTVITVLRIRAAPSLWHLNSDSVTPGNDSGTLVPLAVLADCISPYDIPLESIDVVTHGWRAAGSGPVAASYLQTLGPLPAAAHRTVLVILRLDPRQCPDAIARRGGGSLGAIRAATVSTRRVARRLRERGVDAVALRAAEIDSATHHLVGGCSPDELTETWNEVRAGAARIGVCALEPSALAVAATQCWRTSAPATSLTIRLSRRSDRTLDVAALLRVDEPKAVAAPILPGVRGAHTLAGSHYDGISAGLPIACHSRLSRRLPTATGTDALRLLSDLPLPAGGCGQLIGAAPDGRAVALPLAGPGISTVTLTGTSAFVAQTVLRTVATGVPVVLHTTSPHRWGRLVDAVANRQMLSYSTDRYRQTTAPVVSVFDGVDPTRWPAAPGTRFVVISGEGAAHPLAPASDPVDGTIHLTQSSTAPQQITVRFGQTCSLVTMVATPAEWDLIGVISEGAPR